MLYWIEFEEKYWQIIYFTEFSTNSFKNANNWEIFTFPNQQYNRYQTEL